MSVEAASAELKMEVAGFVEGGAILAEVRQAQAAAAHAALAAHPELDPEYAIAAAVSPVLIEERQKLLGQAKRDARKAVLAAHSLRRLPQRERLQVAAGAGIGKTQGVIDVIAAQKAPLVVYHYVPTHKLADGVATRYRQREVRTYVIRGRTAVGPDGQTMCRKAKLAEALGKAGRSVKKSLCKNEQGQCEHYGRCPFMRQVAEIETGERPTVIIMPHEYLTTPKPKGPLEKALPEADFAVVDETPLGALLAHKTLKLDDLGRPEHWQGVPESATGRMEDFLTTCRTIRGAFTEVNGTVRLSRVPRRLLDEIEAAAAFADEHAGAAYVAGLMGMDEDRAVALADRLEPSPRGAIARMLKTLVAERKLGRDVVHGIEVRGGEIHLRWRHRAKPGAEAVLAIDADAGEAFGRTIWGEDLRHVSLPVRRNAFVTQMNDSTFAKSSLLGGTTRDSQQTAARKLRKVRRFIADLVAVHGEGKVLAVANKPVRCRLTGEDQAGKLPAAGICGGAFVAHFGAIRGIDDWKDCACVVIIGREQLPVDTAEADARAFYWDDPEPLDLGHDGYTEEDRGYRMAAERAESAAARVHPDPRVQALHELKREREVGQAIDRLRLVHRKEPAQVYVLGSLVLDVTVDRLADFDDVLVEAGIAAALGRHGGVLPLGADWLMEHEPCVLVPNVHAERPAKRSLEVAIADMSRRVEAGALFANLKPQNSNRYLIENCGFKMEKPDRSSARPANDGAAGSDDGEGHPRAASSAKASAVRLVRYRLEGRRGGKPSVALVAADHADPAGALERVLGQQVGLVAGGPAAPNKAGIVLPAEVAAGVVMPFENVSAWERAARSEIVVRHRMSFPELAVWDAGGRPAGWHFGLPLPGRYWSGANEGEASAT
jgi:hypothetical protein